MCCHSSQGGLGYPNIALYYDTTQLMDLVQILNIEDNVDWIEMHWQLFVPTILEEFIWNNKPIKL